MNNTNNQKRCLRCGGNLYLANDYYGWYEECLQCGFTCDLQVVYKDNKEAEFVRFEISEINSSND
jgi:hypothetical protein